MVRSILILFLLYGRIRGSVILVGCKHRASEDVFYIGGRGCVLCQIIEPVTFARCAFIIVLPFKRKEV